MRSVALLSIVGLLCFATACAVANPFRTSASKTAVDARRALVLGGGGATGHAWEVGVLKGLQEAGIDLTAADLIVGTSAGAVIGAAVRSGQALDVLYIEEVTPSPAPVRARRSPGEEQYLQDTYRLWQAPSADPAQMRREVGRRALEAPNPVSEEVQRVRWRSLLQVSEWPEQPLELSAVDVLDGTTKLFDRSASVPLEVAVAASTAIPGLNAPITVGDRRYMDGGIAGAHIEAAKGYGRVVVLVTGGATTANRAAEALRSSGGRAVVIAPDAEAATAIGTDRFVGRQIAPSAEAGLQQAASIVDEVRKIWT